MFYFLTAPVSVGDASPQRVTIRKGLELPLSNSLLLALWQL